MNVQSDLNRSHASKVLRLLNAYALAVFASLILALTAKAQSEVPAPSQGAGVAPESQASLQRLAPASYAPGAELSVAILYLKTNRDRFSMLNFEDWFAKYYSTEALDESCRKKTHYPEGTPEPANDQTKIIATFTRLGLTSEHTYCDEVGLLKAEVDLGQRVVNFGLMAKSLYFPRTLAYLKKLSDANDATNLPHLTEETEWALINTAIDDFTNGEKLAKQSDPTEISNFEKEKHFAQGPLEELQQRFEKTLKKRVEKNTETVSTSTTVTNDANGIFQSAKVSTQAADASTQGANESTQIAVASTQNGAGAPPSAASTDDSPSSTTATTASSTGSVGQYFQARKLSVTDRATLIQEELASGYMKVCGRYTIGYELDGSLPVGSSNSGSSNSSSSGVSSASSSSSSGSSVSATNLVTSELLLTNGGLLNFFLSPFQLTKNESPQDSDSGRQYESDRDYFSYQFHKLDANGNYAPAQYRYDESSLLFFVTDGIGMKAYQKSVAATTTASAAPELEAAGEAYVGAGIDGPTFDGLTGKKSGYFSLQAIGADEIVNRGVLNSIFAPSDGTPSKMGKTSFETGTVKFAYNDGSWSLAAFYSVPFDSHTRFLMRDVYGLSLSYNGKTTKGGSN
jgi:hypothetical protein